MANTKVTELTELGLSSITATDLFLVVDDIEGTPTSKKVSFGNIKLALTKEKTSSPTISAGALTLNLNNGNIFLVDLNANITSITISNVSNDSNTAIGFTLIFKMDGTARSVTWPSSIKWSYGVAPTLSSTNGYSDVLSFTTTDGGTKWFGFVGGQYFA
jgi:hypothetical protein